MNQNLHSIDSSNGRMMGNTMSGQKRYMNTIDVEESNDQDKRHMLAIAKCPNR